MKARFLFIPAILMVASCQIEQVDPNYEEERPEVVTTPADSVWTLTIQATKGEPDTKALDLVNDGTRLNAYWKDTETVTVYKGGTLLGTLNVVPDSGEKPTTATLTGPITTGGLSVSDELYLLFPNGTWNYIGQNGALTGSGSIEDTYAYASATVTVSAINGVAVTTTKANFANQESIYRFGFKVSGDYIDPKAFTVSAAGGQLVQSMSWNGSAWAADYGNISVTPASAPGDHFYYVSLRNDQTSDDTYNFTITGSDDALYMASKNIPSSVLDTPGKFISAKNITATKPDFSPAGGSTDTAL